MPGKRTIDGSLLCRLVLGAPREFPSGGADAEDVTLALRSTTGPVPDRAEMILRAARGLPLESVNERRPTMATYRARSRWGRKP